MIKNYNFIIGILCCLAFAVSCDNISSKKEDGSNTDTLATNAEFEISSTSKNVKEIYNKQRFKNTEHFVFANNKGFTYKGKGGTVLVFSPNVFDCKAQDSVKLEVCEFTDITSMVQANLGTLSNDKLLESNGMVYCKAYSGNKEIELKKGKSFKCMFNKPKLNDFKLFEGEDVEGIVNWKKPINQTVTENKTVKTIKISKIENSKKEALTICTYGTPNDISDIENYITFSENPSNHFISYFIDDYDISYSDLIPFDPDESIMLNFTLTAAGRLKYIDSDSPIKSKIKSKLIGYFQKMPVMNGYTNPETGAKEDMPIYVALCPNKSLKEKLGADAGNMSKINQTIADKELLKKERQLEFEKEQAAEAERFRKEQELLNRNRDFSEKINEATKIVFNATEMGWINCDRFYNDTREKVILSFDGLDQYMSFNIQIVFTKIKSIYALNGDNLANKIPIDEPIKIVFVGMKNKELFFYNKEMTTSSVNKITFATATKINETDLNSYIEKSIKQ